MWRFYAELFVLVLVAFIVGAAVTAAVLRIVVKGPERVEVDTSTATAGTPGGPA